jgi:hypothetical protein
MLGREAEVRFAEREAARAGPTARETLADARR